MIATILMLSVALATPEKAETLYASSKAGEAVDKADGGLRSEIDALISMQDEIRMLLSTAKTKTTPIISDRNGLAATNGEVTAPRVRRTESAPLNVRAAADAMYRLGHFDEALALYEETITATKADTEWLILQRANCQRWLGNSDRAITLYQELIGAYPDSFWVKEAEWWLDQTEWKLSHLEP